MKSQKIIALVAFILMSACAMVSTKQHSPYMVEQKRPKGDSKDQQYTSSGNFIPTFRYGRSGGGGELGLIKHYLDNNNNNNKIVKLTQRAFQVGSRFGKRGGGGGTFENLDRAVYPSMESLCPPAHRGNDDLSCKYTGVADLYRCIQEVEEAANKEDDNEELSKE